MKFLGRRLRAGIRWLARAIVGIRSCRDRHPTRVRTGNTEPTELSASRRRIRSRRKCPASDRTAATWNGRSSNRWPDFVKALLCPGICPVFRAFAYSSDAVKRVEFSPGLPIFIGGKRFVHFHGNESTSPRRHRRKPGAGRGQAETTEQRGRCRGSGGGAPDRGSRVRNRPLTGEGFEPSVPHCLLLAHLRHPRTPFVVAGKNLHHDFARPPIVLLVHGKSLSSIPTATTGAANPHDACAELSIGICEVRTHRERALDLGPLTFVGSPRHQSGRGAVNGPLQTSLPHRELSFVKVT